MDNCPDCQGLGFVEHDNYGDVAFLPCHMCDGAGELDLDARLNDMQVAFAAPIVDAAQPFFEEDIPF